MASLGKDSNNDDSIILEDDNEILTVGNEESVPTQDDSNTSQADDIDNPSIVEQPSEVVEEDCKLEAEDITIDEICDKSNSGDEDIIIDEQMPKDPSDTQEKEAVPAGKQKEISAFRMHMGREEIERMISEGTLEKVSEGYYKVKADSLKELKISGKSFPVEKGDPKKASKPGPLSKKQKVVKESSAVSTPAPVTNVTTAVTVPQSITQVASSSFVQQTPSYIALMPVNQVAGNNNNTLLALPMQQNMPITYNPNLPTYVALPPQSISAPPNTTQVINETGSASVVTNENSNQIINKPEISTQSQEPPQDPSVTEPSTSTPSLRSSALRSKSVTNDTPNTSTAYPQISTGVKRKSQFENARGKKPYKFAKPLHKKKKTSTKAKDFVSDFNSSDEDDDNSATKSRLYGMELAAMFFKKIGEPKKQNKSLLDKLHKSIFQESNSESEQESDESDIVEELSQIKSGKTSCQVVNCPGPGRFEAYVGPGNNSRLSIIRGLETKMIKNFMYEVYKVRVTSAGREANTNILIPVPEGYKFQVPSRTKEEYVEFAHIPHEDPSATNYVSPKFLEKLASTELKLRKYKDEIKVLRQRYLELLQEYANRPQFSTLSDLVGAAAKFLTEDQLVFFLMQLKAGAHNMQGIRYSVREKVLALSIYQKSPEVYKWFRKLFNLPSKRVLDQWLEDVGSQDPQLLKKLMYHIYTTYNFKANV